MLDGTGELTWLTHSGGIGALIRLRGPDAHREGFGRTLMISFRAFLVADAFIRGQPCFLAGEEWRSAARDAIALEVMRGRAGWLGDIVDLAFIEATVCPGLFARTHSMVKQPGEIDVSARSALSHEITSSLETIMALQNSLAANIGGIENQPDLLGSVPADIARNYARSSLDGMRSAVALLNQLLTLLESDRVRRLKLGSISVDEVGAAANPWSSVTTVLPSAPDAAEVVASDPEDTLTVAFQSEEQKSQDWLDQVALSMGMLAIKS
jgi:hypothetical protein